MPSQKRAVLFQFQFLSPDHPNQDGNGVSENTLMILLKLNR